MANITNTKISQIIEVKKIGEEGFISVIESEKDLPFEIKRVYYIYDVTSDAVRGMHAHKKTKQVLFCIRGSITLLLDNGIEKEELFVNNPNQGVLLDTMVWHEMHNFTKETLLLVLASEPYVEEDYIRDYQEFESKVKELQTNK